MKTRPKTIVRPGQKVIRVAHSGSYTIQSFLRYLNKFDIHFVPKPLNLGGSLEELTYLPGKCYQPYEVRESKAWSSKGIVTIGKRIRLIHDISADFLAKNKDLNWFPYNEDCSKPEVICHNDLGPWNIPISAKNEYSFIDWEMASPGLRIWDVAQIAWNWAPIYSNVDAKSVGLYDNSNALKRISLLIKAYGFEMWTEADILEAVFERQQRILSIMSLAKKTKDPLLQNWLSVDRAVVERDVYALENLKQASPMEFSSQPEK